MYAVCPECGKPCTVVGEGWGNEEQFRYYPVSDCCTAGIDEKEIQENV